MFRQLDEKTLVGGQISPADMDEVKRHGVTMIVNNRPDGEEFGQPRAMEIEAAAAEAGIDYRFIPVAGGISEAGIEKMAAALGEARGPVLAFCRSGTRSTYLWALARARMGDGSDDLVEQAAAAGYDLAPIKGFLDRG